MKVTLEIETLPELAVLRGAMRGLTRSQLAKEMGISPMRFRFMLDGRVKHFKAEEALKLIDFCDLTPGEAMGLLRTSVEL